MSNHDGSDDGDDGPIRSIDDLSDQAIQRGLGRNLTRAIQGLTTGSMEDLILGALAVVGAGAELGQRGAFAALERFDLRRVLDEAVRSYVFEQIPDTRLDAATADEPVHVHVDGDYLDAHPGLNLRVLDFVAAQLGVLLGLRPPPEPVAGVDDPRLEVHYDVSQILRHLAANADLRVDRGR